MIVKQLDLFKAPKRELSTYRERKGRWINYIKESKLWKNRIKKLANEMLSANKSKA